MLKEIQKCGDAVEKDIDHCTIDSKACKTERKDEAASTIHSITEGQRNCTAKGRTGHIIMLIHNL